MNYSPKLAFVAAVLLLIGAGCPARPAPLADLPTAPPPAAPIKEQQSEAMKSATGTEMQKEGEEQREAAPAPKPVSLEPYYIAYSAEGAAKAFAQGRAVVYYFWAAWCPICRAEEPKIKERIESSNLPVAGFRVNYDVQSDLKSQYKIPYQHTTVFLNAKGEEVGRLSGPSTDDEFSELLKKAAAQAN